MSDPELQNLLIAAMLSVAESRSCSYLAGPITSGPGFLQGLPQEEVEASNRLGMANVAKKLRAKLTNPVIDSAYLIVPTWDGAEYSDFYLRVIDELCFEVRFMPGWEYSSGATKEYVFALGQKIPCLDLEGRPIALDDASKGISVALERTGRTPLRERLNAIVRLRELGI